MKIRIAVVGATGRVGQAVLEALSERGGRSVYDVYALASERSHDKKVTFDTAVLQVLNIEGYDFSNADIAIFAAGSSVSQEYALIAAEKGCTVIDNSSLFRMDDNVPLVIPEINPEDIALYKNKGIIANPNCSTIQMLVALHELHKKFRIKRIVVATYQSVSGAGKKAMDELFEQSKNLLVGQKFEKKVFTKQISFNCIPHIDIFTENGDTKEEEKMHRETRKILHSQDIQVSATCVRVPVFVGHSEAINVEFHDPFDEEEVVEILHDTEGVLILDRREDNGYATPIEVAASNEVYISRIRRDNTVSNGLNMWTVSDNLRRGAAYNAVLIAEHLIKNHL